MKLQSLQKPLATLVSLSLVLSLMPTQALAEEVTTSEEGLVAAEEVLAAQADSTWTDEAGITYTYRVSSTGTGTDLVSITDIKLPDSLADAQDGSYDLVIPGSLAGKIVASLGWVDQYGSSDPVFGASPYVAKVGSVTIPDSVMTLAPYAFASYSESYTANIKTITFADGCLVADISEGCFLDMAGLANVVLPEGLQTIGSRAFEGCTGLQSIELPSELQVICTGAFKACSALGAISIPDSVTTIEEGAFRDCAELVQLGFGASSQLQNIDKYAFMGTKLTQVDIPNSTLSIGESAFDGLATLEAVSFGTSQEASQLQTIGTYAFRNTALTSITLPNRLESYGYVPVEGSNRAHTAFDGCEATLTTINWPTEYIPDKSFTVVGGFADFVRLEDSVVNNLPWWISEIDDYAFYYCGFEHLVIPGSVTRIGSSAFYDPFALESLAFEDGSEPLRIEEDAFSGTETLLNDATIILPERVSYLECCFGGENNTYYVYNPDIQFACYSNGHDIDVDDDDECYDPWDLAETGVCYYPKDAAADSHIVRLKNHYEQVERELKELYGDDQELMKFIPFDPDAVETYTITGSVPEGATVLLEAGLGVERIVDESFTRAVERGSNVLVHVSLDNYAEYVISPDGTGEAAPLTQDWTFAVTEADMTPLSSTGMIQAHAIGDHSENANIVVVDQATGKIVRQGTVLRARVFFASELPAGTYSVIAYAQNDAFKRIASMDDFALMGFGPSDYAQTTVQLTAGEAKEIELQVPALDLSKLTGIITSGQLSVPVGNTAPDVVFYARASYAMADGREADSFKMSIPEGLEPVTVTSPSRNYGIVGYDGAAHTLTLDGLSGADRTGSTLSIGLKASAGGSYAMSASLTSDDVTVPLGSASVGINSLTLVVPTGSLDSTEFDVTVYAAPQTEVSFTVAGRDAGSCTTNKVGRGVATLRIPDEALSFDSFLYNVSATTGTESVSDTVSYSYASLYQPKLQEFFFVHAGTRTYLAKDGKNLSGGYYTCVINPGVHGMKHQPWPFTAVFDSLLPLQQEAGLSLGMLDDSMRYVRLSLAKTEDRGNGVKRYTYQGNVVMGTGQSSYVLQTKDVPARFDVTALVDLESVEVERPTNFVAEGSAPTQEQWASELQGQLAQMPDVYQKLMSVEGDTQYFDIFGGGWRHENWDHDSDAWKAYEALSDADKQEIQQFENEVVSLYRSYAQIIGDKKPLTDYSSLEEYLQDNWGYATGGNYDPAQLEREGYVVSYYGSQGSSEWTAVKMEDVGTLTAQGELVAQSPDVPDIEKVFVKSSDGSSYERLTSLNADTTGAVSLLSDNADKLADMVGKSIDTAKYGKAIGGSAKGTGILSTVLGLWELYDSTGKREAILAEIEKREGELRRMQQQVDYYEKNNPDSPCIGALKMEMEMIRVYLKDLKRYNMVSWIDMPVSSILNGVGMYATAASVIPGVQEVSVPTAVGCFVASATWSQVPDALNRWLSPEVQEHLDEVRNYRYIREDICREFGGAFGKSHYNYAPKTLPYSKGVNMDPSGFVYAGVPDNRVEGVTATIYQLVDGEWVAWDEAAQWDEVNPQETNEHGLFAWNVPQGTWKAVFQKDGYKQAESDELPVPPEWADVAINMVSTTAPKGASHTVAVDYSYVDVIFDQYMKTDTMPEVTVSGATLDNAVWRDVQTGKDELNNDVQLSNTLRVPLAELITPDAPLEVVVSAGTSYTGVAQTEPYRLTVKVEWPFIDVNAGTPHAYDICWLAAAGISTGWTNKDGTREFRGMSPVVRQDMAAFLYRLAGSPQYVPSPADVGKFRDVNAQTPHATEIWWLASTGISEGWKTGDGTREFRGMDTVKRQDMAAFLRRLTKIMGGNDALPENAANPFRDVTDGTAHREAIIWLASTGVTTGWTEPDGSKTYRGMSDVVRQDMAAFLHRLDDYIRENPA